MIRFFRKGFSRTLADFQLLLAFTLGSSVIIILIGLANRGFDLTDEGYYLLSIAEPSEYSNWVSHFGFIYHYLYLALGSDITSLRIFNISVSILFVGINVVICTRKLLIRKILSKLDYSLTIIAMISITTLIFWEWFLTPSYNHLNAQGCLLISAVFLRENKKNWGQTLTSVVILAIGISLIFLAKPTSFLFILLLVILFLAQEYRKHRKLELLAILISFLTLSTGILLFALRMLYGDISEAIIKLKLSSERFETLESGHSLANLFRLDIPGPMLIAVGVFVLIISILLRIFPSIVVSNNSDKVSITSKVLSVYCYCLIIAGIFILFFGREFFSETIISRYVQASIIVGLILLVSVCVVVVYQIPNSGRLMRYYSIRLTFLSGLAYGFAFGTGRDNVLTALKMSMVIFFGLWLILARSVDKAQHYVVKTSALLAGCISLLILATSLVYPYRIASSIIDNRFEINLNGSSMRVESKLRKTIERVNLSKKSFPQSETVRLSVLDFTGKSPGIVYSLGGKSVGLPWFMGGYTGSDNFIRTVLTESECSQLATSYVLIDSDLNRSVDVRILDIFGFNLKDDYEFDSKWPINHMYDPPPILSEQFLFRPKDSEKMFADCKLQRQFLNRHSNKN